MIPQLLQRHHTTLRRLAALACLGALASAASAPAQTPLSLFNGSSLLGWNTHGSWTAHDGALTTSGEGARSVLTAVPFADMHLELEYNESAPMGAKLRLWTTREATGGLAVDLDTTGAPAGLGGIESLSHASLTGAAPGWHRLALEASHGQLSVRIDGQPAGSAGNLGTRGGFLALEASGNGTLQVRNLRLTPLNLNNTFNGSDLSGWKSIARNPDAKGGVGHAMEKTLTFGIGGGSTKPHEAKWTVRSGAIHGEDGPGGLEYSNGLEDGIVHLSTSVKGSLKPDNVAALSLRGAAGQLGSGYGVGLGPYSGTIDRLAKHAPAHLDGFVDETIVIAGRTIAIWTGGTLSTVHTDTRPEGSNVSAGARTGGGTMTLLLPPGQGMDVKVLSSLPLPKTYGLPPRAPAPAPPANLSIAPTVAPVQQPVTAPSAAEQALLEQQKASQQKDQKDQQNKQRVAALTSQALTTPDPQQQMSLYNEVIQIDPSNAAAIQGYKEAQGKVQAQQAQEQQTASAQVHEQQQQQTREQTTNQQLGKARVAFLNGHLSEASAALSVAERVSPGNPLVRELRSRITSAQAVRSRLFLLGSGAGLLALVGAFAVWRRRRKQQRFPVLEIVRGFDQGQSFPLDKDLVRIGAVPGNGSQKNDIVLHDIEHALSRFHCEVARKDGELFVTDLSSSNGTRLDGTPLKPGQPERLRKGSTISLANTIDLRFGYDRRAGKRT